MKRAPMKRGTSTLARTPMKRAQPVGAVRPERIKPVATALTRPVRYAEPANDLFIAVPKRDYIRSPALLASCRELPCQHCGRAVAGTVCAAHSNWGEHGKGGHIKADDNCVAALCDLCHVPILDQGSKLSKAERRAMWLAAHVKTVAELIKRALWPAGVPVPDVSDFA